MKPIIGVDRALQLDFCACKLGGFGLSVFFGACRTAAEGSFFSVPRAREVLSQRKRKGKSKDPFRARVEYADLNER